MNTFKEYYNQQNQVHVEGWDDVKQAAKAGALGLGIGMLPATAKFADEVGSHLFSGDRPTAAAQGQINNQDSNQTSQFSNDFVNYIKVVENGIKSGWESKFEDKWSPHASPEGGSDTIAYGHKIKPGEDFSKGLTEKEATTLLMSDLQTAVKGVKSEIGEDVFNKLDLRRQEMLIDFYFNLGTLSGFPKFVKAVIANDEKVMRAEYVRKYKDSSGKWKPIADRNNRFASRYFPQKKK